MSDLPDGAVGVCHGRGLLGWPWKPPFVCPAGENLCTTVSVSSLFCFFPVDLSGATCFFFQHKRVHGAV